jgi:hypothetical protein
MGTEVDSEAAVGAFSGVASAGETWVGSEGNVAEGIEVAALERGPTEPGSGRASKSADGPTVSANWLRLLIFAITVDSSRLAVVGKTSQYIGSLRKCWMKNRE